MIEPVAPNCTIEGSYIKNEEAPVSFPFKIREQNGVLVAYAVLEAPLHNFLPEDHVSWLEKALTRSYNSGVGDSLH